MEFNFNPTSILRKPISVYTGDSLPRHPALEEKLIEIIDELGVASAKAQGLRYPITTVYKLKSNPSHRVYIMIDDQVASRPTPERYENSTLPGRRAQAWAKVVGLLKMGRKGLFVIDEYGRHQQITPLCVLDFYVHEDYQRQGYGKHLFEYMLQMEMRQPDHLAYDKPSPKLLAFLKKYYGLHDYIPQANNFVVFREYGLGSFVADGVPVGVANIRRRRAKSPKVIEFGRRRRPSAQARQPTAESALKEPLRPTSRPVSKNGLHEARNVRLGKPEKSVRESEPPSSASRMSGLNLNMPLPDVHVTPPDELLDRNHINSESAVPPSRPRTPKTPITLPPLSVKSIASVPMTSATLGGWGTYGSQRRNRDLDLNSSSNVLRNKYGRMVKGVPGWRGRDLMGNVS
ncbi:touch receptor neuron protein Mec-17-domain-containing protein [Gaertneriomyces semiglobifer]|nr:touch receptor neuron protein Mec-17-domain-containing protein [Gaertneriomyces semiglobifer]